LITPDTVVLFAAPGHVIDVAHQGHVVLVPKGGDEDAIERAEIAEISAHGLEDADGELLLVVTLASSTRFVVPDIPEIDVDDVRNALRSSDGNLRQAMQRLGIGSSSGDDSPPSELERVPAIDLPSRATPARLSIHPDLDSVAFSICIFVPWCIPHPPKRPEP